MHEDSADKIDALLKQVGLLKDKSDALASFSGEKFNVFSLLGREDDEVHTHSAILADLLNPKGTHGQGSVFARLFLERLDIENLHDDLDDASVTKEKDAGAYGRIDILFETKNTCLVIENKIHADDQSKQLERYHNYVKTKRVKTTNVIYLTLSGSDPSEYAFGSLGSKDRERIRRLSYKSDIVDWLDACIKEVARVPQVRELLIQYQNLLRKLTGSLNRNLTMELKELLRYKQGEAYNFELFPLVEEAMKALCVEVEWNFWQDLLKRLTRNSERDWSLNRVQLYKDASENAVKGAYENKQNKWHYGWTFRVCPKTEKFYNGDSEVVLRVAYEYEGLYYGFCLVKQSGDGYIPMRGGELRDNELGCRFFEENSQLSDKQDSLRLAGMNFRKANGMLGWKYPEKDVGFWKEKLFQDKFMRRLIEDEGRAAVVNELADEIEKVVAAAIVS